MAETGTMTLADQATAFFAVLASAPAAREKIAPYPVELLLTTPQERFAIPFSDGLPGPAAATPQDAETGYWTFELRGERPVFEAIFAGALTMGEGMYAALLIAPEEKSKHNLTAAVGQTIRLAQEAHRRAKDPRRQDA